MASPRDGNRVTTIKGALNTDGVTVIDIRANPSTNALFVSNGTTGTNHGVSTSQRDDDRIPILMAVSSSDYETPVEVYADSNGNLLIQST